MSGFSDYLEDKIINVFLRNTAYTPVATVYAAIHTADPLDTGLGNTGSTRTAVSFAAPSPTGSTANSASVTFASLAAGTYAYVSLWDALTNGNCFYTGPLTSAIVAQLGDSITFNAGQLTVTNS